MCIRDRSYPLRLEYTDPGGTASIRLSWASSLLPEQVIPRGVLYAPVLPDWQAGNGSGLVGHYFSDSSFSTEVFTRTDAMLDFGWGADAPDPRLPTDN